VLWQGQRHLEGGRRPVFSLIAAGLTAWTINLVRSTCRRANAHTRIYLYNLVYTLILRLYLITLITLFLCLFAAYNLSHVQVASTILLNLIQFCGTDEFVFLHVLFFLLSWIMAYLVQLIEEGVGVDGYMQVGTCNGCTMR